MYLHLDTNTVICTREIVAILDIENSSVSKITREFFGRGAEAGARWSIVNGTELPKSFLLAVKAIGSGTGHVSCGPAISAADTTATYATLPEPSAMTKIAGTGQRAPILPCYERNAERDRRFRVHELGSVPAGRTGGKQRGKQTYR